MKLQCGNYTFVRTGSVSPEQYVVYSKGNPVGRVWIHWGSISAYSIDRDLIYNHQLADGYQGLFASHEQRKIFLQKVSEAFAAKEAAGSITVFPIPVRKGRVRAHALQ